MKISSYSAVALTLAVGAAASAQSVFVTHSVESTFVDPGSVACATDPNAPPQRTTENSYYRSYDLSTFTQVTGPFNITMVEVGVENATHPLAEQELTINFYIDCNGGEPLLADLTLIGSTVYTLFDVQGWIEEIPVDVTACADATLVVEVNSVDHRPETENAVFFMGSNAFGETGPSYLRADACGLNEIGTLGSIGFPNMHIVINLLGEIVATCDDPCEVSCPCACDVDTSTGLGVCDIFDFLGFQNAFVGGEPCACDLDTSTGLGVCDIFDFLGFQNDFVTGCP